MGYGVTGYRLFISYNVKHMQAHTYIRRLQYFNCFISAYTPVVHLLTTKFSLSELDNIFKNTRFFLRGCSDLLANIHVQSVQGSKACTKKSRDSG